MITDIGKACTGCGVCAQICPKQAIQMEADTEGFLYPVVNASTCVECGICRKLCPSLAPVSRCSPQQVLAAKHVDSNVRMESASGGVFTALSDKVLEMGGAVYGAVWDQSWKAVHTRAVDKAQRDAMRGSKYIQSDLTKCYDSLCQDARAGIPILFTGTPCQCAAVKRYFEAKKLPMDHLVFCEVICFGVNSPQLWSDYCDYLTGGKPESIRYVNFRDKHTGWKTQCIKVVYGDTTYCKPSKQDPYCQCFNRSIFLRHSCYQCPYIGKDRVADISMADFWSHDKLPSEFVDNKGLSMVFVNTHKGSLLWQQACSNISWLESDIATAESKQRSLRAPAIYCKRYGAIRASYSRRGLKAALRKGTDYGVMNRVKKQIKRLIHK